MLKTPARYISPVALFALLLLLNPLSCAPGRKGGQVPSDDPQVAGEPGQKRVDNPNGDNGPGPATVGWLQIKGNRIYDASGKIWAGRGFNMHDTRGCDACTLREANVEEVKRRIDVAVDTWKASFIRILLESYKDANKGDEAMSVRKHHKNIFEDPQYLEDIKAIVAHAATKPGLYIMLAIWKDPSLDKFGLPTDETNKVLAKLTATFLDAPHVMFGVANEPEFRDANQQDQNVFRRMESAVQAIRDVENAAGKPHHVVAVQGTRWWARILDYYLTNPITVDGGDNVAYEVHPYTAPGNFEQNVFGPAKKLPVIIGEFGPARGSCMYLEDAIALMERAQKEQIPWAAWSFFGKCARISEVNEECGPTSKTVSSAALFYPVDAMGNVIKEAEPQGGFSCTKDMPIVPTAPWGEEVQKQLSTSP